MINKLKLNNNKSEQKLFKGIDTYIKSKQLKCRSWEHHSLEDLNFPTMQGSKCNDKDLESNKFDWLPI